MASGKPFSLISPGPQTWPASHPPVRTILNAVFCLLRTGCPWRYLPRTFPPAHPQITKSTFEPVFGGHHNLSQVLHWVTLAPWLRRSHGATVPRSRVPPLAHPRLVGKQDVIGHAHCTYVFSML